MSFGQTLKTAREQQGHSLSTAAESTHMKVQIIEDLENEDFRRIAAPIYGRGFVKLYAEFLDLDPEPLIREFMDIYTGKRPPTVNRRTLTPTTEPQKKTENAEPRTESEPPKAPAPITRTPYEATALRPEPPPRPAVRPIEPEAPPPEPRTPNAENKPLLVLEPEEPFDPAPGTPDFFKPQPAGPKRDTPKARKPKDPIFDMAKHLDNRPLPDTDTKSAEAAQRRNARIQSFLNGFRSLKTSALGGNIPENVMKQYRRVLIIAGALLLACTLTGIGLLFKMTSKPSPAEAPALFDSTAPIPDLYAD